MKIWPNSTSTNLFKRGLVFQALLLGIVLAASVIISFILLSNPFRSIDEVQGAFISSGGITIDGSFSDWGTTTSPVTGVGVSQDASNSGTQDGSGFNGKVSDIDRFWVGMQTKSGGTTVPTTGNEIENFYFRIDNLKNAASLDQNFNIQLNLGVADAGKADHLLQLRAHTDGDSTEVTLVLFEYGTDPAIAAFTSGDITGKVSNVASPYSGFVGDGGTQDTNATGAIGQHDGTNYAVEVKIPVSWFTSTYGGAVKANGSGASTLVTAVFTSTGSLGSVGTVKDTLNDATGATKVDLFVKTPRQPGARWG